jgi:thiol-disulfide isomerase/thioredoxin
VGSPAPALNKVQAFRGSPPAELTSEGPYLLFFWATWCGPCKAALPELAAFERERRVPVMAITDEPPESVKTFLEKHKGPFPSAVATDEFRQSFLAYGVSATPSFVLVGAEGKIQSVKRGYRASDGLMIDDWEWGERRTTNGE